MPAPIGVVIATRNRRDDLCITLPHLLSLPERPPIVVVDNSSTDGTPAEVRRRFPDVELIRMDRNRGAAARTVGVRALRTPHAAFADDDSWWDPGSLSRAVKVFERHSRLALIAARILVGPDGRIDPNSRAMAESPLGTEPGMPGPSVLGFLACGAVVRTEAYLG